MRTRYQVLITEANANYPKKSYDFSNKKSANAFLAKAKEDGAEAELWDCYHNELSNMFNDIFK